MQCLRGREESIMTRGFSFPEQGKEEITMEMQRLWEERASKGKVGIQFWTF